MYVFARDFVTHTAGRFDQESLRLFADAYQDVTPLTIGELWAIPIMLRLALVENLCGLAGQTLRREAGTRSRARQFAAEPADGPGERRDAAFSSAAKASATFLVEILHNLRDQSVASTAAWRWLQTRLTARGQSPDELLRIEQQREAIDQLSIANIINTMRVLSALDWPTFVEAVSRVERILRRDPARRVRRHGPRRRAIATASRWSSCRGARASTSFESPNARSPLAETAQRERPDADRVASRRLLPDFARTVRAREGGRVSADHRRSGSARLAFRHPALGYLGSLALTTALFEASLLLYARNHGASVVDDCCSWRS